MIRKEKMCVEAGGHVWAQKCGSRSALMFQVVSEDFGGLHQCITSACLEINLARKLLVVGVSKIAAVMWSSGWLM